jgi:hypothetical protein
MKKDAPRKHKGDHIKDLRWKRRHPKKIKGLMQKTFDEKEGTPQTQKGDFKQLPFENETARRRYHNEIARRRCQYEIVRRRYHTKAIPIQNRTMAISQQNCTKAISQQNCMKAISQQNCMKVITQRTKVTKPNRTNVSSQRKTARRHYLSANSEAFNHYDHHRVFSLQYITYE